MISILFVCLGNICRSPMAEFVMKDLVRRKNLEGEFSIASAATSDDEIGNPVYPPVRRLLEARGISCAGKTAHRLQRSDYTLYDYIVGMDEGNRPDMLRLFGADPWYTRDFTAAERDIDAGCAALLEHILNERASDRENGCFIHPTRA